MQNSRNGKLMQAGHYIWRTRCGLWTISVWLLISLLFFKFSYKVHEMMQQKRITELELRVQQLTIQQHNTTVFVPLIVSTHKSHQKR